MKDSSLSDLVKACAVDPLLFCRTFFKGTFRQPSPPFHAEVFKILEDPQHRRVALEMFRGAAKTTILRAYVAKRLVYGVSRTVLFVGLSQEHAKASLNWLRTQVEFNRFWTTVFGVEKGRRWTEDVMEIHLRPFGHRATVMALGITGQIRGINIGDYRPDLIVVDDPMNEETAATPEQRRKIEDLVFGALDKSLAPETECPDAKIVILATSLHEDDLINNCHRDPAWASRKFGIFDESGESRWPERFPTETLKAEKEAHMRRGQHYLRLWLREMECTAVGEEGSRFRLEWLRYWEALPEDLVTVMGIDPVPPVTDAQMEKGLGDRDYEVLAVVGFSKAGYFLLDYSMSRGHTPEWTVAEFFRLLDKWRPLKVRVEGVAYQRTLRWILENAMRNRGRYVQIDSPSDRRSKVHRVDQALSGIASQGRLYVHRAHREFIEQFGVFPQGKHDDVIDAVARAVEAAQELALPEVAPLYEAAPVEEFAGWAP